MSVAKGICIEATDNEATDSKFQTKVDRVNPLIIINPLLIKTRQQYHYFIRIFLLTKQLQVTGFYMLTIL